MVREKSWIFSRRMKKDMLPWSSTVKLSFEMGIAPTAMALLVVMGNLAGGAEPRVLVDDPLMGASQGAVERVGGEFLADGWHAVRDTDYLRYALPADVLAATVEFDVRNIRLGASGDARKHPFAVADRYLGPSTFYNGTNSTTLMVRVWASERDGSQPGKTRLRADGLAYGVKDAPGSRFQADSKPLVWNAEQWCRFRIRWTQTTAAFERDGEEISRIKYQDRQVAFRQVFINMEHYGIDMHGYNGAVYRNVRITTP